MGQRALKRGKNRGHSTCGLPRAGHGLDYGLRKHLPPLFQSTCYVFCSDVPLILSECILIQSPRPVASSPRSVVQSAASSSRPVVQSAASSSPPPHPVCHLVQSATSSCPSPRLVRRIVQSAASSSPQWTQYDSASSSANLEEGAIM